MPKANISFHRIEKKHHALVQDWLQKKHIQPYYFGEGLRNTLKNLELAVQGIDHNGEYSFEHWIACVDDQPMGFLMTSLVAGPYDAKDEYNKWFKEGKKTITLDLLIGEEIFLGKGLSSPMIQEFLRDKFPQVSTVLIDPELTNSKAIHVYEKVGFKKVEKFTPKFNPVPHWMMRLKMKP